MDMIGEGCKPGHTGLGKGLSPRERRFIGGVTWIHGGDGFLSARERRFIVGASGVTRRSPKAGIHGGDGFPSARERRLIVDSRGITWIHGGDGFPWGFIVAHGSYAEGSCRGYRVPSATTGTPTCTGTTRRRHHGEP